VLTATQMPANKTGLFLSSQAQVQVPLGDGLRCAGGSVMRLATKTNVGGASQYPAAGDPSVSVKGMVSPGTRNYQAWFRNAAAFCNPETFNLTNGVSVVWTP